MMWAKHIIIKTKNPKDMKAKQTKAKIKFLVFFVFYHE